MTCNLRFKSVNSHIGKSRYFYIFRNRKERWLGKFRLYADLFLQEPSSLGWHRCQGRGRRLADQIEKDFGASRPALWGITMYKTTDIQRNLSTTSTTWKHWSMNRSLTTCGWEECLRTCSRRAGWTITGFWIGRKGTSTEWSKSF